MLRVGLTGGIGSGKTTVAEQFAQRGVPVIDADEIARRLTGKDEPVLGEIGRAFGNDVVRDGVLDRRLLAERVFGNATNRKRLESILHPMIRDEIRRRTAALDSPYCIVVIPLLAETGQADLVDRILVVDADERIRVDRVRKRDRRPETEIRQILSSQVSADVRLSVADDVLQNNGTVRDLERAVEPLHRKYLALAADSEA